MQLEFYRQMFEKYSDKNFHENPSNESGIVTRTVRWTDGGGQT